MIAFLPERRRCGTWAACALLLSLALPARAAGEPSAKAQHEQSESRTDRETKHDSWLPAIARFFNFAILAGTLAFLLRKPLAEFLEARTAQVRQELKDAAQKLKQAEADRANAEARLSGLEAELRELRARAKAEAEAEQTRILGAAEEEAGRIRDAARREIASELELARRHLVRHATELAVDLARKKLAQNVSPRDREVLFEKGLDSLKEVR